jgi:hypothetical protein
LIGWIRPSKKDVLPVAPLIGGPHEDFDLDFRKIQEAAGRQFDDATQNRIYFYVEVFLSICHSFRLDKTRTRAEYRHLAHEINRHSASSVSRYFAELGHSEEPEKLAVVSNFRGLFPTTDTRRLRRFAPLIGSMRPYPRSPGRQVDSFSGMIAFLDLCFPDGSCYPVHAHWKNRKEVPGFWTGTFVRFVCEIILQLKPYMRPSDFDFLPKGIVEAGLSEAERNIIGQRCRQVLGRLKRIGAVNPQPRPNEGSALSP